MNRADRSGDGKRQNSVGFALQILQRRLASSPAAIHRSLERRRKRLEERLREEKLQRQTTSLIDVTVNGARAGDLASASLVSSTRFIELEAAVWSNNAVRVMARNISGAVFDLAAATLSVGVTKRRVP